MSKCKILILNGPNLNKLGKRETSIYGISTLQDLENHLLQVIKNANYPIELTFMQHNSEEKILNTIHDADGKYDIMIFNPAAYTHTSVVLRDAILCINMPFIEVHLSNLSKRDEFRKQNYFSDIAIGMIQGLGIIGYEIALIGALKYWQTIKVN